MIKVWTPSTPAESPHRYPTGVKVDVAVDGHLRVFSSTGTEAVYAPGKWNRTKRED
jgi:hypothetical protein